VEHHGTTPHALKLRQSIVAIARLADGLAREIGHLIGPDHERASMRARDASGLRLREPCRRFRRSFSGQGRLIDVGRNNVERYPKALQKGAPVARSGRQNQARSLVGSCCFGGIL
jgi:hypothetical protein